MLDRFSRTRLLIGKEALGKLQSARIAIFGIGGVGGYAAEALARSGVGTLDLIDNDIVSLSNINRQIYALESTIGRYKTDVAKERILDINPEAVINVYKTFYSSETAGEFDFRLYDYVVDAIDTVSSKIEIIMCAKEAEVPVISSMGAGNRINPDKLYICDISEIRDKKAPFVSNILYQLKKHGIESGIRVVASDEKPFCGIKISELEKVTTSKGEEIEFNKIIPASTPFVAPVAGIIMAYGVVQGIVAI